MNSEITNSENKGFDETLLRKLDLNLLVVFAMVMRHGSVQEAARSLYLGPSGVSMALNRLRTATEDPLFVRGRSSLEPTAFATSLFEQISPALRMIGEAVSPSEFEPKRSKGVLRIALSEDLEIVLGSRLQQELAGQAPGMDLAMRNGDYERASRLLDDEVVDLVLTAQPRSIDRRHRSEVLLEESFVVLAAEGRFGRASQISLDDYLSATHALVSATGTMHGKVDDMLAEHGYARRVRVITESFAALPFLLRSGDLIANVPRAAAQAMASGFGLSVYELPLQSPSFSIALTWRARDHTGVPHSWLRSLVRSVFLGCCANGTGA